MQFSPPVSFSTNNASIFHLHLVYSVAHAIVLGYPVQSKLMKEYLQYFFIHNKYSSALSFLYLRTGYLYFAYHNKKPVALFSYHRVDNNFNISTLISLTN